MIGAIAGDIIGSVFERHNTKLMEFPLFSRWSRFTDDTVLTVAVADAILSGEEYGAKLREWYDLYPDSGYGSGFRRWAASGAARPRYSMGNGSAMRVSPVGFAFDTLDEVLEEAKESAEPSHNHPEGVKGARAVASAVFLARTGSGKDEINKSGWISDKTINEILGAVIFKEHLSARQYLPELPEAWLDLPVELCAGFELSENACLYPAVFEEYSRDTLEEAMRVLYAPRQEGLLAGYSLVVRDVIPFLARDVDWP